MQAVGKTHIGRIRELNEDAFFVSEGPVGALPNLCAVADGMGGHNGGEVASREAIAAFVDCLSRNPGDPLDALIGAVRHANRAVFAKGESDPHLAGMGTTFTACVILANKALIVHVGDSRAYAMTAAGTLTQLTSDHSFVNEMVKAGQLTPEQALHHPKKNIITRALGAEGEVEADGVIWEGHAGERILLSTDGLTNMLGDEQITAILRRQGDLARAAEELIAAANQAGGTDNITVCLLQL